jgi:cell wall-associated NlpC family hydrolase
MNRKPGWEERLIEVVADHSRRPFSWGGKGGGSDCHMMAMDAVAAITGTDPYADERGRYATRIGALRRFTSRGFRWLGDAYAAVLQEVPPALAQRGDIGLVLVDDGKGGTVEAAVVILPPHAHGKSETGAIRVPVHHVTRAFRVR